MRPAVLVLLVLAASCDRGPGRESAGQLARASRLREPIGMAELHRTGGVPSGWRFTLPAGDAAAGRRAFGDLGCAACHRIEGESFSRDGEPGPGPDLTGMGSHHPAEYFAESIIDPDAVLVDGPGYLGPDGRSVMPSYPDLTLAQLADLVAYVRSLRGGGAAHMMMMAMPPTKPTGDVPAPPASTPGSVFFVQSYDVQPGRLQDFQTWFQDDGARAFLTRDGVIGIETWVNMASDGPVVTTVWSFRDENALQRFLDDRTNEVLAQKFDEFIGPHPHRIYRQRPVYRVPSLSAP